MAFWIRDPKTKKESLTVTMMVVFLLPTFLVATLKIILTGNTVLGLTWADFTGVDFGAMVGAATAALGGIYGWRKGQDKNKKDEESK